MGRQSEPPLLCCLCRLPANLIELSSAFATAAISLAAADGLGRLPVPACPPRRGTSTNPSKLLKKLRKQRLAATKGIIKGEEGEVGCSSRRCSSERLRGAAIQRHQAASPATARRVLRPLLRCRPGEAQQPAGRRQPVPQEEVEEERLRACCRPSLLSAFLLLPHHPARTASLSSLFFSAARTARALLVLQEQFSRGAGHAPQCRYEWVVNH